SVALLFLFSHLRDACSKQGSADACGEVPRSTLTQPECTIALFVLRRRDPDAPRPFRVPLYPALRRCSAPRAHSCFTPAWPIPAWARSSAWACLPPEPRCRRSSFRPLPPRSRRHDCPATACHPPAVPAAALGLRAGRTAGCDAPSGRDRRGGGGCRRGIRY